MSGQVKPSPDLRVTDMQAMRGSVLGQVHYGNLDLAPAHDGMRFLVKMAWMSNLGGLVGLWLTFRFLNLFPPHDLPFMSALGWFFFFGLLYGLFAVFALRFALYVENEAINKTVAQNRRYTWHSHYDTDNITEDELKKVVNIPKKSTVPEQAVEPGKKYFKLTSLLSLAALVTCAIGIYASIHSLS